MSACCLPPASPLSPSRRRIKPGGLVSGTGRLKGVKCRQLQRPTQPQAQAPPQPTQTLTLREKFTQLYGLTLPPPPPDYASFSPNLNLSSDPANSILCPLPPPKFLQSHTLPMYSSPLDHDELLERFNFQFMHSRTRRLSSMTPDPPFTLTKRERSIIPPGAEGKLLIPSVKLKVRCSSSASLESASRCSSSKESLLSKQEILTSFTLKRPSFQTWVWSYNRYHTYSVMHLPPKKEKQVIKEILDREENDAEIEVEVHEQPKRLFLFAPKAILL